MAAFNNHMNQYQIIIKFSTSHNAHLQGLILGQAKWITPLIPGFRRQKQDDLCEFEASLGHIVRPVSQTNKNQQLLCYSPFLEIKSVYYNMVKVNFC